MAETHVYEHRIPPEPTLNVTVERNSRGYNWTVTVLGTPSIQAAVDMIVEAEDELRKLYGPQEPEE